MNTEALKQIVDALSEQDPAEIIANLREELAIANTIVTMQKRAMISALHGFLPICNTTDLDMEDAPAIVEFYLEVDADGVEHLDMRALEE